jgi:hypothetical protein
MTDLRARLSRRPNVYEQLKEICKDKLGRGRYLIAEEQSPRSEIRGGPSEPVLGQAPQAATQIDSQKKSRKRFIHEGAKQQMLQNSPHRNT